MCGVAIKYWSITLLDLSWVIQDNNLSKEVSGILCWVILRVRSNISSSKILNSKILNVETNIISWFGLF